MHARVNDWRAYTHIHTTTTDWRPSRKVHRAHSRQKWAAYIYAPRVSIHTRGSLARSPNKILFSRTMRGYMSARARVQRRIIGVPSFFFSLRYALLSSDLFSERGYCVQDWRLALIIFLRAAFFGWRFEDEQERVWVFFLYAEGV